MKIHFFSIVLVLFLFSCKGHREIHVMTYDLNRGDYSEKIRIQGFTQAASSMPVLAPRNQFGQMVVERIAGDGSYIHKGDTLCILSCAQMESAYQDLLRSIEILEAEFKKAEADNNLKISDLESELKSGQSRLKIASLDTLKLKYATKYQHDLLVLEMKRALLEKEKTEKKLANAKKIAQSDIRQKQFRIAQQKMIAQTYADQIKSMTIIAQRDGIVTRAESPKMSLMSSTGTGTFGGPVREGSVIFLGFTLLQFPDLSRMQISADASESDFKRIEKGQKVNISVDAADKFVATGKVNRKSLASSTAQRYSASKVKAYEIIIDLDTCNSNIKPGLTAKCEIILKEVPDTLFVPTLSVFHKDSLSVVYVQQDKMFLPVEVVTGTEGDSYTIITTGLKGVEKIALTEPPDNLIIHEKSKKAVSVVEN